MRCIDEIPAGELKGKRVLVRSDFNVPMGADGEVVFVENLRRDPREKKNDESFARELAGLAEIYVNDAFAVAHREDASIVGVPKFLPSYAGLLMRDEVF